MRALNNTEGASTQPASCRPYSYRVDRCSPWGKHQTHRLHFNSLFFSCSSD